MNVVSLKHVDQTNVSVTTSPDILREIADHFTGFAQNYRFNPKFKNGMWDGKIRMMSLKDKLLPAGLASEVQSFCESRGYQFLYAYPKATLEDHQLRVKEKFTTRYYQSDIYQFCLTNKRATIVSPTASGKSLSIYTVIDYLLDRISGKVLLIVPKLGLITQMTNDFIDYSNYDISKNIHQIHGTSKKTLGKERIVISTWQSLIRKDSEFFDQFDVVIADEVHNYKAHEIKKIIMNMKNTEYRFGFTGTLDEVKLNRYTIQGLFGRVFRAASTVELIDQGILSKMSTIKIIQLNHQDAVLKMNYQQESDYLISSIARNEFIVNLANELTGIVLVLFKIRNHGETLFEMIEGTKHFIDGTVVMDKREIIRNEVINSENAKVIASLGTFSEGVNIPNIQHIINAAPTKSLFKVLQSIGRGLRKDDRKDSLKIYDIADRFSTRAENTTYKHMKIRKKIYDQQGFKYRVYEVPLKEKYE